LRVVPAPVKDFESKGIIFVESKVTIDINGEHNGSEITYEMLMKEAQKLDADDIINVRIDEIEDHTTLDKFSYESDIFAGRQYIAKTYIYKATALAIKYTKTLEVESRMFL
jgi:hypothetical protein